LITNHPLLRVFFVISLLAAFLAFQPGPVYSETYQADGPSVDYLYSSAPDAPDSALQSIVEDTVKDLPGTWGVAVKKLDTGQFAAYNGDKQQVSASLYKLWVLTELYKQAADGTLNLDSPVTITADDAAYDASLGELRLPVGEDITLRNAAAVMVHVSDNTAAHLLVRTEGPDNISAFMKQTGLTSSVFNWDGGADNLTTPLDMLHLLERLATSKLVDGQSSQEMVDLMLGQQINNLLPPGMPDNTPFAHKTGALEDLLHDAGIVYSPAGPYIIVCMTSELDDYGTAWTNMPELSKRVYEYFNSRPSSPALYFPDTRQTVGHDFLKFWTTHGGLNVFGHPIGAEQLQNGVLTQQFERARFQWSADSSAGTAGQAKVALADLGSERAEQLRLSWPRSTATDNGQYFDQTGQSISGEFLDFWLNNGAAKVFGYPISPAQSMRSPADDKTYMTQWFQKARMEIHPDLPPGSRVVLAALGNELTQR
jgi:beta-lactamase class A